MKKRFTDEQIGNDFDLFDTSRFRTDLERIVCDERQSHSDREMVRTFLDAWDTAYRGRHG